MNGRGFRRTPQFITREGGTSKFVYAVPPDTTDPSKAAPPPMTFD